MIAKRGLPVEMNTSDFSIGPSSSSEVDSPVEKGFFAFTALAPATLFVPLKFQYRHHGWVFFSLVLFSMPKIEYYFKQKFPFLKKKYFFICFRKEGGGRER